MQVRTRGAATYLREVAIILLAAVNVALLYQNVELRSRFSDRAGPVYLETGDSVGPIAVRSLRGENSTLEYTEGTTDTILLFLSPSCPYCEALIPTWVRAIAAARQRGLRVVVLVRDREDPREVADYLERWEISSLETFFVSNEARIEYRLYGTPLTLVISREGVVENAWVGMWGPDQRAAASDYFDVDLAEIEATGAREDKTPQPR